MTRAHVRQEIRDIIRDQLNLEDDSFEDKSSFKELGADSLDAVEMVMRIEEKFDLTVPDEEAKKLLTVGVTINYVWEKLGI